MDVNTDATHPFVLIRDEALAAIAAAAPKDCQAVALTYYDKLKALTPEEDPRWASVRSKIWVQIAHEAFSRSIQA